MEQSIHDLNSLPHPQLNPQPRAVLVLVLRPALLVLPLTRTFAATERRLIRLLLVWDKPQQSVREIAAALEVEVARRGAEDQILRIIPAVIRFIIARYQHGPGHSSFSSSSGHFCSGPDRRGSSTRVCTSCRSFSPSLLCVTSIQSGVGWWPSAIYFVQAVRGTALRVNRGILYVSRCQPNDHPHARAS